ncbi:competence type IV pilus major pilin ComGC [Oceanobacillus sp. J11TS1]|uniref:competence type IV pilus major pilin ComGC n=1 Tax=Oceanobacillus sp. J11TS1 TaxID=2807191 RepID=UPI001B025852|nr:competence type IV pilus major pilin ComGC [Oceanobacillus sp. J11TS1]GIO23145.1 competence protein ComGC [Oceanobacillus sp. J11TS1]
MLKNQKGFTLIEMLIVIMVISVIMILIIPNLGKKTGDVHTKGCDALISVVQAQADAYQIDTGNMPSSLDQLQSADYITADQLTCSNGDKLSISNGVVNASN